MNNRINEAIKQVPADVRNCLRETVKLVEDEYESGGKFTSIDDFIDRMFERHMDLHAFTIFGKYIPMSFSGNGDASMLRAVLALRGFDPDYSVAPDIEVYAADYDDDEELPFM